MYKSSDFVKPAYRTREVMKILGISYETIKAYDRKGIIPFRRTEGGRRLLFREDLLNYLDSLHLLSRDKNSDKRDVVYARVSSYEQKTKGDLDRQALFLLEHASHLNDPLILKEVGSGLNDRRKKLQELIRLVMGGKVSRVFVTYRDRLTRFGYHYLETVFSYYGVPIIVVKDAERARSVEDELVEDMMSLIASFSGKLYGLRSGRNKKVNGKTGNQGGVHETAE